MDLSVVVVVTAVLIGDLIGDFGVDINEAPWACVNTPASHSLSLSLSHSRSLSLSCSRSNERRSFQRLAPAEGAPKVLVLVVPL